MHNAQKSFLKLIMIDTQFIYYEDEKKKKKSKTTFTYKICASTMILEIK